jgi:hypothetical protein
MNIRDEAPRERGKGFCTYCGKPLGQGHEGFCLTRIDSAREEWITWDPRREATK